MVEGPDTLGLEAVLTKTVPLTRPSLMEKPPLAGTPTLATAPVTLEGPVIETLVGLPRPRTAKFCGPACPRLKGTCARARRSAERSTPNNVMSASICLRTACLLLEISELLVWRGLIGRRNIFPTHSLTLHSACQVAALPADLPACAEDSGKYAGVLSDGPNGPSDRHRIAQGV